MIARLWALNSTFVASLASMASFCCTIRVTTSAVTPGIVSRGEAFILATIAVSAAASGGADGQDPTAVAQANVDACLKEARANCAEATCACQAERTMTACTE